MTLLHRGPPPFFLHTIVSSSTIMRYTDLVVAIFLSLQRLCSLSWARLHKLVAASDAAVMAKDLFVALPNEVFEVVLTFLDLESLARLRLTSTRYAGKCLCPAFTRYYSHQETDLSASSLQRLLELSTHPVLGPAVDRVAIVAVYYDPSVHISKIRRLTTIPFPSVPEAHVTRLLLDSTLDLSWVMSRRQEQQGQFVDDLVASFAQIFENLASLGSLELRTRIIGFRSTRPAVRPAAGMNWNALWTDCHRLLRIMVLAMARSKISVDTLSIFDQSFGKVQVSPEPHHPFRISDSIALTPALCSQEHSPKCQPTWVT